MSANLSRMPVRPLASFLAISLNRSGMCTTTPFPAQRIHRNTTEETRSHAKLTNHTDSIGVDDAAVQDVEGSEKRKLNHYSSKPDLGSRWKSYVMSPTLTVCPALFPPAQRHTTSLCSASTSTSLPACTRTTCHPTRVRTCMHECTQTSIHMYVCM